MFGTKPFNPILGETFQSKIGETEIYVEQTCHHPPIMNFYIVNPNFKVYGYEQIEANAGANSITASKKGKLFIELSDKTLYKITKPNLILTGTTMGKRLTYFSEELIIQDMVKKIKLKIKSNIYLYNLTYLI
jgi:hypothetical protein